MTATEFYNSQKITDATRKVIDRTKSKFTYFDVIKFAEAYHREEMKEVIKVLELQKMKE